MEHPRAIVVRPATTRANRVNDPLCRQQPRVGRIGASETTDYLTNPSIRQAALLQTG